MTAPNNKREEGLAGAAERGDEEAFEALVVRELPALREFVRGRMGALVRAREAESDIVQSTVREVLERRAAFDHGGEEGFRRWLFTTAMRKILDKSKRYSAARRDVGREVGGEEPLAGQPGPESTPSEAAVGAEELERMTQAFERLAPDYREVIFLSRVLGLPRAEIARELDRTEASVRNLLHRALAKFARHLEDGTEAEG